MELNEVSKIKNGHAWTNGDERLLTDLDSKEIEQLTAWIREKIIPRKTPTIEYSSYNLKHRFEEQGGFHITNNQMKDAMLACGYSPVVENELNWWFCISKKSPGVKRIQK